MKRSQSIDLDKLRKAPRALKLKPLSVAVSGIALAACSSSDQSIVYQNIEQCVEDNPGEEAQCALAYQQALAQAKESGPRYGSRSDCEWDFGVNNCRSYGNNWFIPFMAGYVVSGALDSLRYAPLYTSYSRHSPYYGRWSGIGGSIYSRTNSRSIRVDRNEFKPKPKVQKTIKRGGFGSKAAAKSKWGSSSKSWGGGSKSWGG